MKQLGIPVRFRTYEDALLYFECLRTKQPFPAEKWIHPFREVDNLGHKEVIHSREYKDAPYEIQYV